ncbi:MAG: ABC transporter ATP-binding protein [Thermoanaerobaculia bacterium]|nr:ABC transporter ATP-binding protein [Thermoanaerobaculia bacterium]
MTLESTSSPTYDTATRAGSADLPVRVEGLRKTFYDEGRGEVHAVGGIDFHCNRGEIFGLLGANGAGKTTTLRMLSTILEPSEGDVWVEGNSVREAPEAVRRSLGFFSASTALYPRLTARETLEFFAGINRYPADRVKQRVGELIERFGITAFQDARVDKLSSGMKQKVSIARTLAHDPPILIFDEPTVGLDVLNALALVDNIRELRDEGKTLLFSTHIMSEAEKLCDRIAIIHGGKILTTGTLDELRQETGEHYLEEIFVHYVKDAEAATRELLEEREQRELEQFAGDGK